MMWVDENSSDETIPYPHSYQNRVKPACMWLNDYSSQVPLAEITSNCYVTELVQNQCDRLAGLRSRFDHRAKLHQISCNHVGRMIQLFPKSVLIDDQDFAHILFIVCWEQGVKRNHAQWTVISFFIDTTIITYHYYYGQLDENDARVKWATHTPDRTHSKAATLHSARLPASRVSAQGAAWYHTERLLRSTMTYDAPWGLTSMQAALQTANEERRYN